MKIGIISDTHGDTEAWQKALKYFKTCRLVLHSGDVLYHGVFNPILPSYDGKKLADMLNQSPVPLIFARGNCDCDVDQLALKYLITSLITETIIEDLSILIHHGDKYSNKELADKYNPDIIISGHSHVFGIESYKNTIFLNPGSASLPKDPEKTPTVALIEDKTIRILNLDNGEVLLTSQLT